MLSRLLVVSFYFLVFLNGATDRKYVCPLEKNYPDFLDGKITIEQIKNYSDSKTCRANCVNQEVCLLNENPTKKEEVFSISDVGRLGFDIQTTNQKTRATKFNGIEILNSSGVVLFSVSERQEQKLNFLFEEIPNSELLKVGLIASIQRESIDLRYYDNSLIIVASKEGGSKITKSGENIKITFDKDNKGNVITLKNGEKYKNGRISYPEILTELGVSIEGNTLRIKELTLCGEGQPQCSQIPIPINGSKAEYLFENEVQKKQTIPLGGKKISFITKGLMDTQGVRNYSYIVEIDNGTENKEVYMEGYLINLTMSGDRGNYYCDIRSDVKGDLGENSFSNQEACNKQCKNNQDCFNQTEGEGINLGKGCRIVESMLFNPIISAEGESLYLNKKITTECEVKVKEQIGCKKWETKIVETPNIDSVLATNLPKVETNEKDFDFSKALGVFGKMNALESAGRVFSGESSYCEYGTWFDEPNWGMLTMKYAIAIGGPFLESGFSNADQVTGKILDNSKAWKDAFKDGITTFAENIKNTTNIVNNITTNLTNEIFRLQVTVAIKAIDCVVNKECNKNQEIAIDQYNKNQMANATGGISTGDISDSEANKIALEYAQCMTRYGLSYDVLSNWQVSKEYATEFGSTAILDESYKYPLLFDPKDAYMLKQVTENNRGATTEEKDKYFYARYKLENTTLQGKPMILLYPLTVTDRIIAGEVACGGINQIGVIRKKYGERFLNPKYTEPTPETLVEEHKPKPIKPLPDSGNEENTADGQKEEWTDKKIGTTIANIANSIVPFPYNLIGMVAMDLLDMFDWGNLCNDLNKAEERGDKESIKTNRRKKDGLCVYTQTDVVWWVGYEKARERDYYCCYDTHSTKAFAQGLIQQQGLKISKNNCSPITLDHLKNASFSPCKKGQDPLKDKCFPEEHFKALQKAYIQGTSIQIAPMVEKILENMFQLENVTSQKKREGK